MAAPLMNQFWKQRSKHGRDKIFSTPDLLWEACTEYFEATDQRKWIKTEFNGKDAVKCEVPTETPYTLTGLFIFLDIDRKTWDLYRNREDFIPVTTRVEQIITTQKLEGAIVGAFNANIVARIEGLSDKVEQKNENYNMNVEPTAEEAQRIKEALLKSI
jgi:hypothetical protein